MMPVQGVQLGYVDEFAGCAVGFGIVPDDVAGKTDGADDELGKFLDGKFLAGADVDVAVTDFAE